MPSAVAQTILDLIAGDALSLGDLAEIALAANQKIAPVPPVDANKPAPGSYSPSSGPTTGPGTATRLRGGQRVRLTNISPKYLIGIEGQVHYSAIRSRYPRVPIWITDAEWAKLTPNQKSYFKRANALYGGYAMSVHPSMVTAIP